MSEPRLRQGLAADDIAERFAFTANRVVVLSPAITAFAVILYNNDIQHSLSRANPALRDESAAGRSFGSTNVIGSPSRTRAAAHLNDDGRSFARLRRRHSRRRCHDITMLEQGSCRAGVEARTSSVNGSVLRLGTTMDVVMVRNRCKHGYGRTQGDDFQARSLERTADVSGRYHVQDEDVTANKLGGYYQHATE